MCLILFAWKSHPKYPLVVAANRDEFYERNTAGIAWWPEHPHILAGRDQADVIGSPGTWLGLSKHGRFSALTNVRSPSEKKPDARTRGELPLMTENSFRWLSTLLALMVIPSAGEWHLAV